MSLFVREWLEYALVQLETCLEKLLPPGGDGNRWYHFREEFEEIPGKEHPACHVESGRNIGLSVKIGG